MFLVGHFSVASSWSLLFLTGYHCGEKIAELTLIQNELIFAN